MATTLNSVTIADPYDTIITRKLKGSGQKAANGTWQIDYYSTTLRREVVALKWRLLSSSQRATLLTQVQDAIAFARTLILPDGENLSVYFDPNGAMVETKVRTGTGILYNIELSFTEAT